jgi:ribosomal protein S25
MKKMSGQEKAHQAKKAAKGQNRWNKRSAGGRTRKSIQEAVVSDEPIETLIVRVPQTGIT